MTVSSTTNKVSYSGNGSNDTFAYTFKIFADADLKVFIRDSSGTETLKTITTHYTVTNAGVSTGGNVVFTSGNIPSATDTVVIQRELSLTQGTDYVENDPFPAQSHEDALDRLTFVTQQIQEEVDRSIKASVTNTISGAEFTVSASDRANKVFAFDGSGDLSVTQELGTFRGNWAASTDYSVRDLVKDTSTNNIFIVNTAHTSSGAQPLTTNANSAKYDLIVDAATSTTSATSAAASATTATTQASTATTKAAEAATSATASAASATAAAASETAAAASETASAASETASAASETASAASQTAAAASASSASTSASTATTKASEASASASTATTKASEASASQSAAASSASNAATSESNASTSETNAASSATAAAASAAAAAASFDAFDDIYLGAKSSAPSVDNDGDALTTGDQYFNTTNNTLFVWNGSAWQAASPDIVGDTTPQLGGNLDLNSNNITGTGNIDVTGTVDVSGSAGATLKLTSTDTTGADTELLGQIDFVSSDSSTGSAGTQARIKGVYEDNGDSSGIAFLTGASTGSGTPTISEVMRIRHEGNVGIGTAAPNKVLHLETSGETVQRMVASTTNLAGFYFGDSGNGSIGQLIYDNSSDAMRFNTNGSEAARIDSSGNLHVGKTASGLSTAGLSLRGDVDVAQFTRDGNDPLNLNRLSTQGSIVGFYYDSTLFGQIGVNSSDNLYFSTVNTGFKIADDENAIIPANSDGSNSDNDTDLGMSAVRFKDAYFSNRVYTGGIAGENDTNTQITFPGSDVIKFLTGGGEAARITSGGSVGIGTSGPSAILHVDAPNTTAPSLTFGAAAGQIFQNENSELAIGLSSSDPYPLYMQGRTSGNASRNISLQPLGGNLLVGKTGTSNQADGFALIPNGASNVVRDGGAVMQFNRKTSDGDILQLLKGSTEVGVLGSYGNDLYLGTEDTGLTFNNASDLIAPVNPSTGAARDDAIDLGATNARFKDLYLSGGAYLGGTAAANHLDDYEEGTFTPTVSGRSFGSSKGFYTKIGRTVYIHIELDTINSAITGPYIESLPFTADDGTGLGYAGYIQVSDMSSWTLGSGYTNLYGRVEDNTTRMQMLQNNGENHAGNPEWGTNGGCRLAGWYNTA